MLYNDLVNVRLTSEEKILIIKNTKDFKEIPANVFPTVYRENYFFISYSHKDYKDVYSDIFNLEENGINIWYDKDIHIGENWSEVAELYIAKFQCTGIIFYLTENSILSTACNEEVKYALSHNKKFFSINKPLDGCVAQCGYDMLCELEKRGHFFSEEYKENFKKAFNDKGIFLSFDDFLEKKIAKIKEIKPESLLIIESDDDFNIFDDLVEKPIGRLISCNENSLLSVNINKSFFVQDNVCKIRCIDACVFANYNNLRKIELPDSLEEIGEHAFRNCTSLENIDFSKIEQINIGDYAFYNCEALQKIDLTNAVRIGNYAFARCKNLVVEKINGSIGCHAFSGVNLKNVKYIAETPELADYAFEESINLASFEFFGVFNTDFPKGAFSNCSCLKRISKIFGKIPKFNLKRRDILFVGESAFV